jgi:hypothetical protein
MVMETETAAVTDMAAVEEDKKNYHNGLIDNKTVAFNYAAVFFMLFS